MSKCPYCGLFRYDLSGCICSDQDYNSEWSKRFTDELFGQQQNSNTYPPKRIKNRFDI